MSHLPATIVGSAASVDRPFLTKFDSDHKVFSLPLGTLDDDPGIRPQLHVYVARKAPWFTISDDLPQFPELPR